MDGKKFLLEHFEKLALGLAGLILAAFMITTILTPQAADAAAEKVRLANKKIKTKSEQAEVQIAARPDEPLTHAKQVTSALAGGPTPEKAPAWLFHKRPAIVTKVEGVDVPEPKAYAPAVEAPKGDLGRIGIRWAENAANHLAFAESYDVWRAEEEPKDWKKITTQSLPKTQTSFTDSDVKTKVKYFYMIEQHAVLDREAGPVKRALERKAEVVLPPEMATTKSDVIGPITTLPDCYLRVISVVTRPTPAEIQADKTVADRKATAYIEVYRFFPEEGTWAWQPYPEVKPDEKIGKEETLAGKKKRDFTSGFTLVGTKHSRVKKPGTEIEFDADVAVVKDEAGQEHEINSIEVDPQIEKIKKNPKPGEESGEEGATPAPKKPPEPPKQPKKPGH